MEQVKLKAVVREGRGKQEARKLRDQGFVPGVVYHRGEEAVAISLVGKDITKILHDAAGENVLINLTIDNEKKVKVRSVIIKEIQHHPVKRGVLHIDFNEISMSEKIIVEVEVVGKGEPIGVKQEGGMLDHPVRSVKVQCLPADIPKHIDVDVSGLKLNQAIHVSDLQHTDKIKILTEPELVVFQVKFHEEEVEEVTAEPQEVEVLTEKKEAEGAPGSEKAKEEPKDAVKSEKK